MTTGQIYRENKEIYDKEALEYIERYLPTNGTYSHRPFEMMTHFTRLVVERITDEIFLTYEAQVKNIKYRDDRDIELYNGRKDNACIYTKKQLINMFGFEISLNPHSKSNRSLQKSRITEKALAK